MAEQLRRGQLPAPMRSGAGTPWVHVDEAADAAVAATERTSAGGVYNVAADQSISLRDALRCLASGIGARSPFQLRIVGGGQETLEEARLAAAEAIAYALEGPAEAREDEQTEYLDVAVG